MSCEYIKTCPSKSGWCNVGEPNGGCVDFILNAYKRYAEIGLTPEQIREMDWLYRKKCEEVAKLRRELDEQGKDMGEHISRDSKEKPAKAAGDQAKSKAGRQGNDIPPHPGAERAGQDGRETIYIRQTISISPFVKRRSRFLRKFWRY